ncbi:hypothetical protein RJ639_036556 [Escallonia herrerae]|uniref:Retrotransposon gag domain-containing protein n=1 Tax=Escallonia herrerae TaxID=1293975 RepID=A0AA89BB80_9ASTE|nr:hypothetical protein RJ639_036556 [Escallonia herrerae]
MPEPRSYDGAREARQVDNFFWCLERYFEALDIDDKEEQVQRTVAKELDDLIEERVAHFTKWEVQRRKNLKRQVTELQEEQVACKKELTRGTRQGCITVHPRRKKMPEPRLHDGAREARQVDNFFWHLEWYFEALDIDDLEKKVQQTVASQVDLIFNRLDDLEVDSRLTVLEWKVDVFVEELYDLIEERIAHFTKWEVQRHKDLKRQIKELREELVACKRELTRATRQGCIARYCEALDIDDEEKKVQRTVASQVELIFNRLDDLEVESRLTVLERKVDVFAEELDDLIEERVAHFTKWEVQRRKDLKGQVTELQEELIACKKELTRATRQGCFVMQPKRKKMPEPRSYNGAREARQVGNFFWHLERYFEALDIDDEEEKVQKTVMYLTIKMWEKFKHELKRQFYLESTKDMVMINLRRLRQKGSIHEYVKEHLVLMLEIPEMFERRYCPHNGKMIAFLEKHKGSKGDSSSSNGEARMGTLQMVNAFVQKSKEKAAKEKKSKKRWGLLYPTVDVAEKTQEELMDTRATHNFMSPRVAEWLGLKPTKDWSWFTVVNAEERPTKGVVKNVNLRIEE